MESELKTCHLLGHGGFSTITLENTGPFGDTTAEKLVVLTICALSHVLDSQSAVQMFLAQFTDALFTSAGGKAFPGGKEALRILLFERVDTILNEGAVRGYPARFDHDIMQAGVDKVAATVPYPKNIKPLVAAETHFVSGFIKWLLGNSKDPYYTRSAVVARLAVTLRSVGYNLRSVVTWNGQNSRPRPYRGLVLVTGGSSETDAFVVDYANQNYYVDIRVTAHYHHKTVGTMLWNAFRKDCDLLVEMLQEDFDVIEDAVSRDLGVRWTLVDISGEQVQAYFEWSRDRPRARSMAIRLAAILFTDVAEEVAIYYDRIATPEYLEAAKKLCRSCGQVLQYPRAFQRFLTVSASICMAVLGKVAGEGFWKLKHSSMLDFSVVDELHWLCREVSAILAGGTFMSRSIGAISTIHCGVDIPRYGITNSNTGAKDGLMDERDTHSVMIGWRKGRYVVLPNLLFSMSEPLEKSILGLRCADEFIANLSTRKNGSIHSTIGLPGVTRFSSNLFPSTFSSENSQADEERALTSTMAEYHQVVLGPASRRGPECPLYINIERSPYDMQCSGEPELSLCGRMNGEPLGHVGIHDVLSTLALSWSDAEGYPYKLCRDDSTHRSINESIGRTDDPPIRPAELVYNMSVGTFCSEPGVTPRCQPSKGNSCHHVYVQVANSSAWALFLAGMDKTHSRVCFSCTRCSPYTGRNLDSSSNGGLMTLIGYHGPENALG